MDLKINLIRARARQVALIHETDTVLLHTK